MSTQFEAAARAAVACIDMEKLAEQAADNKARGEMYAMVVHDKHHAEIVVGHALIVVLYGSESAINKAGSAIAETGKTVNAFETWWELGEKTP